MPGYLLKIADFAKLCGTTKDTLLWYDKIGLMHPTEVGENGYRYYHQNQKLYFELISSLKDAGCALEDIAQYLKTQSPHELLGIFIERERALEEEIVRLENSRQLLISQRKELYATMTIPREIPRLMELEPEQIVQSPIYKDEGWFRKNYDAAIQRIITLAGNNPHIIRHPLGTEISRESVLRGEMQEEFLFFRTTESYAGEGKAVKPGGLYLSIAHVGNFDESIFSTLSRALSYIRQNDLTIAGNIYQYDLNTYFFPHSLSEHIYDFQIPIARNKAGKTT